MSKSNSKSKPDLEGLFLLFCQTKDPNYLGQVFDRTATELHQVASHLAMDASGADDLLQATFLVAIERCDRFQKGSRVVPWLFGIMVNESRVMRRRQGKMLTLEDLKLEEKQPTPQQVLEGHELTREVMAAIAKMPEQYHPVMSMYLRYGLSNSEIALNLMRQPATVRKQLSRGLEMLRRALPASLVAGSVALTTTVQGFAATREVLLSKAAAVAAKAASTSSTLVLGKLGLVAGAVTLTAAVAALTLLPLAVEQTSIDELSPRAMAPAKILEEPVGSKTIATSTTQTTQTNLPTLPSRVLLALSSQDHPVPSRAATVDSNNLAFHLNSYGASALLIGAVAMLSPLGHGHRAIYSYEGTALAPLRGQLGALGDLNLDGYPDVARGSTEHEKDPDGTPGTGDEVPAVGAVFVYSGKDGTLLTIFEGTTAFERFGAAIAGVGDYDFDAVPDFVCGEPHFNSDPDSAPASGDEEVGIGRILLVSGTSGAILWSRLGENTGDYFGYDRAAIIGDMSGDGIADMVTSAPGFTADPDGTLGNGDDLQAAGRVYAISGATGSVLWTRDGEEHAAFQSHYGGGVGDFNFDGVPDVVIGADRATGNADGTLGNGDDVAVAGRVLVVSGVDGSTIRTYFGAAANVRFGSQVAGFDDINFDGFNEIVVGAKRTPLDPDGIPGSGDEYAKAGAVHLLSGRDGSIIFTRSGEYINEEMGLRDLAVLGDVDLDGFSDYAVGVPGWDSDPAGPDGTPGTPAGAPDDLLDNGRVLVLSGFDGSDIFDFQGERGGSRFIYGGTRGDGDLLGSQVVAAGDVNLDGSPDIWTSAPNWDADPLGPDGTAGTGDEDLNSGKLYMVSGLPMTLTADNHTFSVGMSDSQAMTIHAGLDNALKNYWLFTGFAASGNTPGVTMAPGVVIPLNQPDPLTSFVISLTQSGGGAPIFVGWKSTLDAAGMAFPSLNTFGPVPVAVGITLHHAALVYTSNGCGAGCDTFQLATNWVPMTTTP